MGYSVFHRKCDCGRVLAHLEQCAPCTSLRRERAVAKAGPDMADGQRFAYDPKVGALPFELKHDDRGSSFVDALERELEAAYAQAHRSIFGPPQPAKVEKSQPEAMLVRLYSGTRPKDADTPLSGNTLLAETLNGKSGVKADPSMPPGTFKLAYPQTYETALQKSADALTALAKEKERRRLEAAEQLRPKTVRQSNVAKVRQSMEDWFRSHGVPVR